MYNASARYATIGLGVWLCISAFLWQHNRANLINTLLMGIIIVLGGLLTAWISGFRFVTALAGTWLITSMFAWPQQSEALTVWHNFMVGIGIVIASLASGRSEERGRSDETFADDRSRLRES